MYVNYIAMKICVIVCINIFSPLYCICLISMPHHSPIMDFTYIFLMKPFKTKISIPFTILFHKILHSYQNLFISSEGVSKGHKHPLIY